MTLDQLKPGDRAVIVKNRARGVIGQRLMDMGFFPGVKIEVVRNAPLVDPVEFTLNGQNISVRHKEASLVEVTIDG